MRVFVAGRQSGGPQQLSGELGPVLTNGSVAGIAYSYTADAAGSVKSIVTSGAGTGKITT
jgi:pectate lyase